MMRLSVFLLAACPALQALGAQTNQRVSLQGSGLVATLFGNAYRGLQSGIGGELQVRYTPGALSFGTGFQITTHALAGFPNRLQLLGGFVEPRYVLSVRPREWAAPYVSARFSLLQQRLEVAGTTSSANGLTANLGGGFLFRLTGRVNGEAGATLGFTRFGQTTAGTPAGSGFNLVLRVGLATGIF